MMNDYQMEELIPIVAGLTQEYTSKQSTSVSYDRARQLMEAVIYCINLNEEGNQLAKAEAMTAKEAYALGFEILLTKVKKAQHAYNEMIVNFEAYENENYYDTVTKAISVFFIYYDVKFAPQETIITMDYPTICPVNQLVGISAIEKYIDYISIEQAFLGALPKEFVIQTLTNYQASYRKQFYNICNIVLRHILKYMLIGKKLGTVLTQEDYGKIKHIISLKNKTELKAIFSDFLEKLVCEKYNNNLRMFDYLKRDIEDFVVEVKCSKELY